MQTFLAIVGAAVLLLLVVVVVGFLVVRAKFRKLMRDLGEGMAAFVDPAIRVALKPRTAGPTQHQALKKASEATLLAAGFEKAGEYQADEMPGLFVAGYARPSDSSLAAIYEHEAVGSWIDLVQEYVDGRKLTVTNAKVGDEMDRPPNAVSIYDATLDASGLLERFEREKLEGIPVATSTASFVETFERMYAADMEWRAAKGGSSEEEIRKSLTAAGETFTDEDVRAVQEVSRHQANAHLHERLVEEFLKGGTVSAYDWNRWQAAVIVVHAHLDAEEVYQAVMGSLPDAVDPSVYDVEATGASQGLAAFEDLRSKLEGKLSFERLGTVEKPLYAEFYRVVPVEAL